MKQSNKRFDRHYLPLNFKLLCYFLLFGFAIVIVLWVFQTFFLESFYTATKSSQVEKNAQVISKSIEENKNALGTIENVASYNSLSVYVYDSTSLFTLKYCCEYDNPVSNLNFQYHDVYSYYKLAEENDGHYLFITSNYKEDSIKGKFERQFFNEYSSSDTAERNTIRYASAPDKNVQNMVYTDIINLQDGSECFLIVTSSITPLTMITGYGEVMRDLPGENTPENIQIIIDEATRLSTLVNDLLDLSKIQSGSIQPEKSEFCLTDSIKNIFTRYAKLKEQDGYNILFESDEDVYIFADELKISQVIYNLVNNAVNYVGEDKTVIVTQKVNGKKVLIEVTDHGDGIPPEKLEYIWDRYYKVDKEHKRGVIGTGLGLSIVKGILDSHKARYGVRSTLGKGSTFWFELDIVSVKKRNKKNSDENKE